MRQNTIILLILGILLIACNVNTNNNASGKPVTQSDKDVKPKAANVIIDIQPFSDMPVEQTDYVFTELKKIYPSVELLAAIDLPDDAYYSPRNRYRADSLLNFLSARTKADHVVIGLTSKDISCTSEEYEDWGIMGYGYTPGNACVASTFRLNKSNLLEQLFKVAIHELGHTQGLDHCPDKSCFMRDAEGKNTTNEEKDFCQKCKAYLTGKGWNFKRE